VKIRDIDVIPLSYATDDDPPTRRSFAVVKVTTDDGIVGWGEASDCYGHRHPRTVKALVDEDLRWLFVGQDPLRIEPLMHRVRQQVFASLGGRELVVEALSAIDIALWDIRGRALGVSVSDLLGRCHDAVPIYAAGKPALAADAAWHLDFLAPLLDRGVKGAKVRPGRDLAWDKAFVTDVRRGLPDDVQMLVDGKYNYFPESALALSRVLADLGVHFFEEPIVDADLDEVRRLADAGHVPLAYGEHCFTALGFRELIVRGGVRVVEPDVSVCGGITEFRRIAGLAQSFGVELTPHCGGLTAIGIAANLHAAASVPRVGLFEFDARAFQPLRDELVADAPFAVDRIVDGCVRVPSGPGLGIDVDESVFERYPHVVDKALARTFSLYGTPHV